MYYDLIIIMVKTYICLVLLLSFISISESKKCDLKTEKSGEVNKVCCADYEAKGNDCIACSIGYTSNTGQMCRRCSNNMYGERCRYECFCSRFEICDNVEGCVEFLPTTRVSRNTTFGTNVTVTQHSTGNRCQLKTESGEVELVCCADSEAKGNYCIACSKGYTSIIGQNCLPCTRKTYGERCKFECHCSDFEICSHVDGCVELSITAGTSVDKTSYITTLPWNVAARTTGDNTDNSDEVLLPKDIIAYYTFTLMVVVPGICLCFIFYKYKIVPNKKMSTSFKSQRSPLPQNRKNIEIEENVYDNIDDTDLLEYEEQMQMSPDDIDAIDKSNRTACRESINIEKHDYSFQSLPTDRTEKQELKHNLSFLISGEDISSNDESQHTKKQDYITLATVHRMESSLPDNEIVTIREHEYTFQYPIQLMKDFIGWPYEYKTSSNIPENTVPKRIISKARGMKSLSCNNLDIKRLKSEIYSGANGKHMNSNDNRLDFNNILKTKSERDIGS